MGVEQHAHQRPSNASASSSGKEASKSSGTRNFPAKMPRRRLRPGPASGPKRATGLPDLAMMISSPATAASTKRDNWVRRRQGELGAGGGPEEFLRESQSLGCMNVDRAHRGLLVG